VALVVVLLPPMAVHQVILPLLEAGTPLAVQEVRQGLQVALAELVVQTELELLLLVFREALGVLVMLQLVLLH